MLKLVEFLHTQTKTQSKLQELHQIQTKMQEDRSEKVLENLRKFAFKGVIENLVGRYQEGTREWVFNEVENWLDDRNSENRVMVISSTAGMGKSVISAVICKRLEEVGRLLGSHFCQYNNARYRNPQLMLQSLACHLCHALPEYKQALVKQLSRNLGKDINSMYVDELFELLFKYPLSTVPDPGRNMLVVIDGLDETEYHQRRELLDVLVHHCSKLPFWVRFLCTTRPERHIAEALEHFKLFPLESNDDRNLGDVKRFIEKQMQHIIKPEKIGSIVEELVEIAEGLMLYANFLVLFIYENKSVLDQGNLDSLPLPISSVYHSYFKRLENELKKELYVDEENFLDFLSAVVVSREPMPIDFVSKLLAPNASSPLLRQKVLRTLDIVSSLFLFRDGCLHFIHKSVRDWLTNTSCYGVHDFTMNEEGHRILASLCANELDDLKQKGVHHREFSSTERYALHYGTRHMLWCDENANSSTLEEVVKSYVLDLELLYAKLCVLSSSVAVDDLIWLQEQKMCLMLSEDSRAILKTLIFLLRKNLNTSTHDPRVFFKTVVKEGGKVLSSMASNLLQNKYSYVEPVPHEIQTQGRRAEAAFKEAMEKGSVEVYRGRIMLIGQDRAGKTSLKKFLLGIPFDPEEDSTVGIKVDRTKFEVEIDQVKNWQVTDHKKLDLSEYREDIAKITAEQIKALEGKSQETTDSMDLEQELNDPSRLHDVNVLPKIEEDAEGFEQSHASPTIHESAPDSNQGSKAEIDPSTSNEQQNGIPDDQDIQLIIDTTAGLTLDDVTEKVEQCLQGLELNDDVKAKEVILSVWDFAGQNLYYASHSVFLSHRAVYVLVHNLSKDLSAQAKPCAKHETRNIELKNPTHQTNLDNLLSWLVSVHCIRPMRDEASEVWEEKEEKEEKCLPYSRPPVFVVGTHADKPFKDIRDMLEYIQDSISGKRYDEHVIRPLYAVDNTRSASDYGVQALQNRISEVLKQEPYMGGKVPIRWFHFEKVVEALVANNIYHMELNELLKHTKRYCHIDKEDELEIMLKFYHDLGVIVKHGRTVVLQALWLIDLFKQLITVRPYDERCPWYSGYWEELKKKGILRMDLVDHVFRDFIQNDLSKKDILKMMEDHGLIAKFSFLPAGGDHQQEYFVPSLLDSLPLGLYEIKPSNRDPCALYLLFLDGFVPHGLFPQLVSRCIVWCSGCSPEMPGLFQNGAIFFFIEKQRIFDLVLICRKSFIKIILTRNRQASAPSTTYLATTAREVRVFLEGTLKDMRKELFWLRNLRYELCVACTHCLKGPDQCSTHSSVCCADDDCLCDCLLPLRPEEQLICRKNYVRERIKICGLENWLLVHEIEREERKVAPGNREGSALKQKRSESPGGSLKRPKLTRPVVKRKRESPGSSAKRPKLTCLEKPLSHETYSTSQCRASAETAARQITNESPLPPDLPGQMFTDLQEMQCDVSKISSSTDLLVELEKIASVKGFVISDNDGLGNCMFHALSEQLNLVKGIKISHGQLRQAIVHYLRNNPKLRDGTELFTFIDGYRSWADYLCDMERDGTWGDHVILYATANCYETYILVISSQSNLRDVTIRPDSHVISTNPLVLGHIHEVHYVSLQPKKVSVAVVEEGAQENDHENGNQECSFKVGEPNDPALNELAGKIAAKWQTLGLYLGIGQDTLDEIDANEKDKPYRMLLRWKNTTASTTLYQDLYNALCHVRVGLNKVAKEFCCKKTT